MAKYYTPNELKELSELVVEGGELPSVDIYDFLSLYNLVRKFLKSHKFLLMDLATLVKINGSMSATKEFIREKTTLMTFLKSFAGKYPALVYFAQDLPIIESPQKGEIKLSESDILKLFVEQLETQTRNLNFLIDYYAIFPSVAESPLCKYLVKCGERSNKMIDRYNALQSEKLKEAA